MCIYTYIYLIFIHRYMYACMCIYIYYYYFYYTFIHPITLDELRRLITKIKLNPILSYLSKDITQAISPFSPILSGFVSLITGYQHTSILFLLSSF